MHSPPQLNSAASTSSDATSNAVAARRAMAAQELKNALEAQMQAKMMLEIADDDDGEHIRGESSQLTDQLGTGSLMDYSASNLVCALHLSLRLRLCIKQCLYLHGC